MGMLRPRPSLWLALLLPLAACDLTSVEEVEPTDVVVAEAYLRPGPVQEVFLYRTLPGIDGSLRVDGASVRITGPLEADAPLQFTLSRGYQDEFCARYSSLPDGAGGSCYVNLLSSYSMQPGETYRLDITTADGRSLTGTTRIPDDFEIRRPAVDSCNLSDGRLELLWTRSDSAWSYQVVARFTNLAPGLRALGVEEPPDSLELLGLAVGRADTTLVFPNELGVFDRFSLDRDVALALQQGLPAGASADILVAAGDRNYVNWVRGGNFNPSGQVRVPSIVGDGTGVFGSLVARRVTILSEAPGSPSCQ